MTNNAQAINVSLYPTPFYIEKDFEPLGLIVLVLRQRDLDGIAVADKVVF